MATTNENNIEAAAGPGQHRQSRKRLVAFLFGLAAFHGLIVNLMPVMFKTVGETFNVDKVHQGMVQSVFLGCSMVALVILGYLTNYIGAKRATVLMGTVAGAGALLFGLARTYAMTLVAAGMMALGTAPLVAVYTAVIASWFHDIRRRMYMWTFAVLAGSSTIATSTLGALLDAFPRYNITFIIFGMFIWAWIALLLVVAGRALDAKAGMVQARTQADTEGSILHRRLNSLRRFLTSGIFNRGALYILGLLIILDGLAVLTMIAWIPSFFSETYEGGHGMGGVALAASCAGVCVGRIVMGILPTSKICDRFLLALCYTGGVLSVALILLIQPPYLVSLALVFLSGAFISAQAPTTGSLAIAKFGERATIVVPMVEAIGIIGGLFSVPLTGYLAERTGELGTAMWIVPSAGFTLALVALSWEFYDRKRGIVDNQKTPEQDTFG